MSSSVELELSGTNFLHRDPVLGDSGLFAVFNFKLFPGSKNLAIGGDEGDDDDDTNVDDADDDDEDVDDDDDDEAEDDDDKFSFARAISVDAASAR